MGRLECFSGSYRNKDKEELKKSAKKIVIKENE